MLDNDPKGDDALFAKSLEAYLGATLHMPIKLRGWEGAGGAPVFLARRYGFHEGVIAKRPCLFMAAPQNRDATPTEIATHVDAVAPSFEGVVVFAARHMASTLRARLLAQGIPFAVPGNQLYIPQLAMDLREHFRAPDRTRSDRLSPVAQAVLFHHILNQGADIETPSGLAAVLPYTPMSLGRAFDELALHNIATIERRGREKTIRYKAKARLLIDMSKTLLRRPGRGVHAVRFEGKQPPMMLAGESALAELTDLAPPRRPTYAIEASGWHDFFKRHHIADFNEDYEGDAIIETWRYDPRMLSNGPTVDALSLYAQFWDSPDERVAQAAHQLLERFEW
jgi:hypothetical protein